MTKYKNPHVANIMKKVRKGTWETKKWRAMELTKTILIGIWTVTIFPLILIWMWFTDKFINQEPKKGIDQ